MGYLAASSPAYGDKKIYVTILERTKGGAGRSPRSGPASGKVSWSRPLPSRSESSPIIVDHHVYFGTENGTVYSMRATTARPVEVPRRRRRQGRPRARRRQALLRHLRRPGVRDLPEDGQAGLAHRHERRPFRPLSREFLRHGSGRVRACLHRQHRRQHVLVLGRVGQARLASRNRVVRVRVGGGGPGAERPADGLLRQLRRHVLRARRAQRQHSLELSATAARSPAARASSAASSTTRTGASGTRPRSAPSAAAASGPIRAVPSTRSSPTARTSTSPGSPRWRGSSR